VGEPVELRASLSSGPPDEPLEATVERLTEPPWRKKAPVQRVGDGYALTLGELEVGRYNVILRSKAGGQRAGSSATAVSDVFEVGA
jgi:hypothetical protein